MVAREAACSRMCGKTRMRSAFHPDLCKEPHFSISHHRPTARVEQSQAVHRVNCKECIASFECGPASNLCTVGMLSFLTAAAG
jgi:hypothetical protein